MVPSGNTDPLVFRADARPEDAAAVRAIVASTGFFHDDEIAIAVELIEERLADGAEKSGYHFLFAEAGGETVGYACYGPVPAAHGSYDLYWVAVHDRYRGRGYGRAILRAAEGAMRAAGGRKVWIETSSKTQYEPTRAFYESCGCRRECLLEDFYAPGDGKVIYSISL